MWKNQRKKLKKFIVANLVLVRVSKDCIKNVKKVWLRSVGENVIYIWRYK